MLGQRTTAVLGALLMAAGHFLMAFEAMLFVALGLLILGIGAFKPNVSTQVGSLYAPGDARRVRAYSIYYVGINIGANKDSANRVADYAAGVAAMAPVADFLTINISSPNTPGLRGLQADGELHLSRIERARGEDLEALRDPAAPLREIDQ